MGGAVSGVAGPNWMLIGDAAACVNPLNGEGIDYGLETGRLAAELLAADLADFSQAWPAELQRHYARGFSVARRLGLLLTIPRFLPATGPRRHALPLPDGHRGAGDGQPRHRRGRRLDRPGLASGRGRLATDRRATALQLTAGRPGGQSATSAMSGPFREAAVRLDLTVQYVAPSMSA